MKTFLLDIIPRIQKYSKKLDLETQLKNNHWVCISDNSDKKTVFIFRSNNELIISENGIVQKASWELLSQNALLISMNQSTYLFKQAFQDESFMALSLDNHKEFAVFFNENKFQSTILSLNEIKTLLENKYITNNPQESPKYYYFNKEGQFGPFTGEQLKREVQINKLNPNFFARLASEKNYQNKMRIKDVINRIQ
jgi:hypothetical protein